MSLSADTIDFVVGKVLPKNLSVLVEGCFAINSAFEIDISANGLNFGGDPAPFTKLALFIQRYPLLKKCIGKTFENKLGNASASALQARASGLAKRFVLECPPLNFIDVVNLVEGVVLNSSPSS
jgi:hypothetical protein